MTIFKCKMCGGALEIHDNETIIECEYCGTQQTLPILDDDRKANLYDRANHFRRNNEFDKAMSIFEQILNEDNTDAETYWSLVLCRYGIEYVEDPSSHKRIPTVNRAQFTSIFDDDNYKLALKYADNYQKAIYENEAKTINEIQKGILAISREEEPFDVFICYKETDNQGRRTSDSVLANELYHQLTQEGFKVFFAKITLEDKLGVAYEPYIFAALNSAKVMVVLGTKPEFFKAVWVKNEWSRYLSLIKQGQKKILIPAYKDMDPYDLPEEFSHLQALDMSKLGFMQDLIRGIKKIIGIQQPIPTVTNVVTEVNNANVNINALLKRGMLVLEDKEWDKADNLFEEVLNNDPECAEAYLGKLMTSLKVSVRENLKNLKQTFKENNHYLKVMRFGNEELKKELQGYNEYIVERNNSEAYNEAIGLMNNSSLPEQFFDLAECFEELGEYKDAKELAIKCEEKAVQLKKEIELQAENARKERIITTAKSKMANNRIEDYKFAIRELNAVAGWKDADELKELCQKKIQEIEDLLEQQQLERKRQTEIKTKQNKKIAIIVAIVAIIVAIAIFVLNTVIIPNNKYNDAMALMNEERLDEAYDAFIALDGYKDSLEKAELINTVLIPDKKYNEAISLIESGDVINAYEILDSLNGHKDSDEKMESIDKEYIKEKLEASNVGDVVLFGLYEQDNDPSNGKENISWLVLDKEDNKILVMSEYGLDAKPYNYDRVDVTWENCTLRKWLNNDFINSAFSDYQKNMISITNVVTEKPAKQNVNSGNNTEDKVFLLSVHEAYGYLEMPDERKCVPTIYAKFNGASSRGDGYSLWWLRDSGSSPDLAKGYDEEGVITFYGIVVDSTKIVVRPAMWISLD